MRAVLQRVKSASVTVNGEKISSINQGILCLIGISRDDTPKDMDWILKKLLNIRVFQSEEGKSWNKSVVEMNYDVLFVSQFTLYATYKGTKPDFHIAKTPEEAKIFYHQFLELAKKTYKSEKIHDGQFGAMMDVALVNDGPVTLQFDSREGKAVTPSSSPITTTKTTTTPKQPKQPKQEREPSSNKDEKQTQAIEEKKENFDQQTSQ